jgi:hypothetical protein
VKGERKKDLPPFLITYSSYTQSTANGNTQTHKNFSNSDASRKEKQYTRRRRPIQSDQRLDQDFSPEHPDSVLKQHHRNKLTKDAAADHPTEGSPWRMRRILGQNNRWRLAVACTHGTYEPHHN